MWEWETSVVLIERPPGEVLLVRQSYGHGFYGLPGGKVEAGETPKAAAARELFEEAGLTGHDLEFLGTHDLVYPGSGSRYGAHAFRCSRFSGPVEVQVPDEISAIGWWPLAQLPEPLTPSAQAVVGDLRAPARASKHEEGTS